MRYMDTLPNAPSAAQRIPKVMWWGSWLRSIAPGCVLRMRQSQSFFGTQYIKRLDVSESSLGDTAAFVDSWLRSSSVDFGELRSWSQNHGHGAVLILDLWEAMVFGDLGPVQRQNLEPALASFRSVILLLPRINYADWQDTLVRIGWRGQRQAGLLRRLDAMLEAYEWLINTFPRCGVVESALTREDFVTVMGLDLDSTRHIAGLVPLLPRDLAQGQLAFHESSLLQDAVMTALAQSVSRGPQSAPHVHIAPGHPVTFYHPRKHTPEGAFTEGGVWFPFVKRHDGLWAMKAGWSLFRRMRRPKLLPTTSAASLPRPFKETERQTLMFLMRYEAQFAAQARLRSVSPEFCRIRGGEEKRGDSARRHP